MGIDANRSRAVSGEPWKGTGFNLSEIPASTHVCNAKHLFDKNLTADLYISSTAYVALHCLEGLNAMWDKPYYKRTYMCVEEKRRPAEKAWLIYSINLFSATLPSIAVPGEEYHCIGLSAHRTLPESAALRSFTGNSSLSPYEFPKP